MGPSGAHGRDMQRSLAWSPATGIAWRPRCDALRSANRSWSSRSVVLVAGTAGAWRLHVMPFRVGRRRSGSERQLRGSLASSSAPVEAFEASERRFRLMVDAATDGVAVHRNGILLYANAAAARILGYGSADPLVGRAMDDFVHPDSRDRAAPAARLDRRRRRVAVARARTCSCVGRHAHHGGSLGFPGGQGRCVGLATCSSATSASARRSRRRRARDRWSRWGGWRRASRTTSTICSTASRPASGWRAWAARDAVALARRVECGSGRAARRRRHAAAADFRAWRRRRAQARSRSNRSRRARGVHLVGRFARQASRHRLQLARGTGRRIHRSVATAPDRAQPAVERPRRGGGWGTVGVDVWTGARAGLRRQAPATTWSWLGSSVDDDGTGMEPSTRARVFEPFFSTKSAGEGHGPGTVDRVRDGETGRRASSSVERAGAGRELPVYLPRCDRDFSRVEADEVPSESGSSTAQGCGNVLVCEDERAWRCSRRRCSSSMATARRRSATSTEHWMRSPPPAGQFDVMLLDMNLPHGNARPASCSACGRWATLPGDTDQRLRARRTLPADVSGRSAGEHVLAQAMSGGALVSTIDQVLGHPARLPEIRAGRVPGALAVHYARGHGKCARSGREEGECRCGAAGGAAAARKTTKSRSAPRPTSGRSMDERAAAAFVQGLEEPRGHARQDRRLRHRRRAARQVRVARQAAFGARERLRLLRRDLRLGHGGRAVRQRRRSPAGTRAIPTPTRCSTRRRCARVPGSRASRRDACATSATREGGPHPACPRSVLKRVLARAERSAIERSCAVEFEFFFFRETRQSLHDKHFADLEPLDPACSATAGCAPGRTPS